MIAFIVGTLVGAAFIASPALAKLIWVLFLRARDAYRNAAQLAAYRVDCEALQAEHLHDPWWQAHEREQRARGGL